MAKGFTPIIGLAVVVALAMVAVFGAMSLTPTPAWAQADAPVLKAVGGSSSASLSWEYTGNTSDVENWQYRYHDSESQYAPSWTNVATSDGDTRVATVMGLENGEEYTFQVRAVDATSPTPVPVVGRSNSATATPSAAPDGTYTLKTQMVGGAGEVEIGWTWTANADSVAVAMWQYMAMGTGADSTDRSWMDTGLSGAGTKEYTVTGLGAGDYVVSVRPVSAAKSAAAAEAFLEVTSVTEAPLMPTIEANSNDPGKKTRYTIMFTAEFSEDDDQSLDAGTEELVIELEDFGFPGSVDSDDVTIRVNHTNETVTDDNPAGFNQPSNPQDVAVSGEKLRITLDDTNPGTANDTKEGIYSGDEVTITIAQAAGLSNPTEGGDYKAVISGGGLEKTETDDLTVPRIIGLDGNDGGRGDTIEVTGKGFKNGHTMTFWLDRNMNNLRDEASEAVLCDAEVMDNDTASCTFDVSNPPFTGGVGGPMQMTYEDDGDLKCNRESATGLDCNFINGSDGIGNYPATITVDGDDIMRDEGMVNDQTFELKAAISISPTTGSVGDSIQIQMTDFPSGASVSSVTIAKVMVPGASFSADPRGNGSFSITIPNDVPQGVERLELKTGSDDSEVKANIKITIAGPGIQVTPASVIANQRVSLVGSGFTRGSYICCVDPDGTSGAEHQKPVVTFGGEIVPADRINDGNPVLVDNGGNWSASVNLPLSSATTSTGTKELRVTDSKGRTGNRDVMIPARNVTVTPTNSRVGTLIVVRGQNFPSKNDGGDPFNVEITYKATSGSETRVSATPDAGGSFEAELTVPTGAAIPSTNTIQVEFEESDGEKVTTNIPHVVPEGIISLSTTRGPAGTQVTISGQGFKAFVPVTRVTVGDLEVTPSPRPSTDGQGMVTFSIAIPGSDVGIQTVEVDVGATTASIGFIVTPSGVSAGDITASAEAVVNLGDKFVRSFHFNNDTKDWTFYDPAAGDANTQENFITGESYWILVTETTEAILNGKTRNLTCVGGDCWNQLVW